MRYINHVLNSWKALVMASVAFLVIPLFYAIFSGLYGVFEVIALLMLTGASLCSGALLYLLYSAFEISRQDRVRKFFDTIGLHKIGNLKLIDEYTNGWGRRVIVTGVYQQKKIQMYHSYSNGIYLNVMINLERDFYEAAATLKLNKNTTRDTIIKLLDEAITTSNDPKFGEIYWELKRRREKK